MTRRPAKIALAFGVVVSIGIIAFAFFGSALLAWGVDLGAHVAGYSLTYDRIRTRPGGLTIVAPDVANLAKEPLFTAKAIDVSYSLKDVFGSPHPFGISGIEIDRPKITIVHHKDGTYNFHLPPSGNSSNSKPFSLPQIRLVIRDGSVGVIDETRIFRHSRKLALQSLQLDANLDPNTRSHVVGGLAILEEGGRFPIAIAGTLDDARGYEFTRITAKTIALAPLIDYALNSPTLHVADGVLNDIDARFYGLRDRGGAMARHLSVAANLDHFQPYLGGIAKPLRDGRGALRVYDDGLAIPKVDGSIAGVPVRIAGAIYDFASPKLRLAISGRGALGRLVTLSDAAKKLPLAGDVAFALFVEGDATGPTTFATFSSPRIDYGKFPLDRPNGMVALGGSDTTIVRAALNYSGIDALARGRLVLAKRTQTDVLASVEAPASRVPYATNLLGPMTVGATVIAAGTDAALETRGVVAGTTPNATLRGTLSVNGKGEGTIGPLSLEGPGPQSIFARVSLDRPNGGGGAFVARLAHVHLSTRGPVASLPGVAFAKAPPIEADLASDVAGTFAGKRFAVAGDAEAANVRALGYPIDDLTIAGTVADGPRAEARARYRGALAPLARAAGGKIAARGTVDIPVALAATGTSSLLAQIAGARFANASVGGVPIDALEATIGVRGKAIDVYGARLGLAGHDVVAQGSFGNGGTLDVSASGVDLAALRAFGLPVRAGTASALAAVGGTAGAPELDAGVAVSGAESTNPQLAGLDLSTSTGLAFSGDRLSVRDGTIVAGAAVGRLDGRIDGLRADPKRARYAFDASVSQADIGTFARLAHAPQYPEGTLDANLRVAGSGASPSIAGRVDVPQGSINGLAYRDATVDLDGTPSALRARGGRVTVGTTALSFAADVAPRAQSFSLDAPHVELSDFDDYFDAGDTLGGVGRISLRGTNAPDRIALDGGARFARTRFRRFELGDAHATFATRGRRLHTDLALGSTAGRVTSVGDVLFAPTQPLRDALHRTNVSLVTEARAVDLGVWLPAAGIAAPVAGKIDGDVNLRGTYPRDVASARARLVGGMVNEIPIRTATLDARAANGRATVTSAVFAIDNLRAHAFGSVGLQPKDPFDLTLDTDVADVGALAKSLTAKTYDVSGVLHDRLRLTGTQAAPRANDVLDATQIRYAKYTLPRAHAELAVTKTRASLARTEIDFVSGRLLASGAVPIAQKPFGIGPATAPLDFGLTADKIDLAQFAAFLPKGTTAAGVFDGSVRAQGSLAKPGIGGTLSLANGAFSGPMLKSKATDARAQVTFSGTRATLHDTSVTIGGGTIVANGFASVPSLLRPANDLSGNLQLAIDKTRLDAPQYLKGLVDGKLTVARTPAAPIDVAGNLAFSETRIPLSALFNPNAPKTQSTAAPLPVRFDLGIDVGRDVRLQSGPVDVGATGRLHVGGTLASPLVSGQLESVGGGTLSFYRTFIVTDGSTIAFDGSGVIPDVDASATTTVPDPETDVNLHVTGPATQLNVGLTSSPAYSREQILGLLVGAQALGAVSGVAPSTGGGAQQNPFQSLAEGQLGTLLTQNVLQPFSSKLGGALGLSNLAVTYLPGGSVNVGAKRKLFRNVNAVFASSFGQPPRESVGLQAANPAGTTAAQVTFFTQPSANQLAPVQTTSLLSTNPSVTGAEPLNGNQGVSFSVQRKF